MQRPEAELSHKDIQSTIHATRRLLAYLLRASVLRVSRERIGEHRYSSLSGELASSLIPLIVSEKSPLGFYRAFCTRFDIDPTGGDSEYGPVEAWLPEGRIRWDRALAAMTIANMRVVVHENPDFLATFARERDVEDDTLFACFPDPVETGGFRLELPKSLLLPRGWVSVWTLVSPMHHGADEKHGNVQLFRRERAHDPLTGKPSYVPFLSGNGIRGLWRDLVMGRHLQLLGLKATDIPPARAHAILAGGVVDKGADSATVNNVLRTRARDLCPPWDLIAGCTEQQVMSGRARVGDAMLVCRENAWKVREAIAQAVPLADFAASLPSCVEMTTLRIGTRQAHRDVEPLGDVQMLFNIEVLCAGNQFVHTIQLYSLDGVSPVTASCFAYLLREFLEIGFVAAGSSHGHGQIATDGYIARPGTPELPSPDLYLEAVERRHDEMIEWLMMTNPKDGRLQKPARTAKPRRGAAADDLA